MDRDRLIEGKIPRLGRQDLFRPPDTDRDDCGAGFDGSDKPALFKRPETTIA